MKRILFTIFFGFLLIVLVVSGFILYEYLITPPVIIGDHASMQSYAIRRLDEAVRDGRIACAGLVFISNGKISEKQCFGAANPESPCDPERSLFTAASVSKAITSIGVLKLVSDNVFSLDEPILPHLRRWNFPGSNEEYKGHVTIRQLLSHTAGLADGFGTGGFAIDSPVQSLPEYLTFPLETNMGVPHNTVLYSRPGTSFSYSTMGYAVLQLLIEDELGIPFNRFMTDSVLRPLGSVRSSYDITEIILRGDEKDLVGNYDRSGQLHPHKRHVAQAGAALKLTVDEFGKLICALRTNPLVDDKLLRQMITPQAGTGGSWGLGLELFGANKSIVGHSGGSFPRSGAAFRLNPVTGNGIGILMTGGTEMIDPYLNTWTYWETGERLFDLREIFHKHIASAAALSIFGFILIVVLTRRIN